MTAAELIEELRTMQPDAEVFIVVNGVRFTVRVDRRPSARRVHLHPDTPVT